MPRQTTGNQSHNPELHKLRKFKVAGKWCCDDGRMFVVNNPPSRIACRLKRDEIPATLRIPPHASPSVHSQHLLQLTGTCGCSGWNQVPDLEDSCLILPYSPRELFKRPASRPCISSQFRARHDHSLRARGQPRTRLLAPHFLRSLCHTPTTRIAQHCATHQSSNHTHTQCRERDSRKDEPRGHIAQGILMGSIVALGTIVALRSPIEYITGVA